MAHQSGDFVLGGSFRGNGIELPTGPRNALGTVDGFVLRSRASEAADAGTPDAG